MSETTLARFLEERFTDPETGEPLPPPATRVVVAESLAGREPELVAELGLGARLAVVSDPATRAALGERVERALARVAEADPVVLPERPNPDDATAARLRAATRGADALVAVGSGTINDLCKHAAAQDGKPYAVFATAPSMNGYTSTNAAITVRGHKKSLPARAAAGVFCDLEVMAAAPIRLIRAGLGDSLCRCTAQADWLLAHLLLDQPYREAPFALLAEDEPLLLASAEALARREPAAVGHLVRTLLLSGFGMTLCGSSAPASQGEHLISHYADMRADPAWPPSFHGEQIGVTTLTVARLQDHLLARPPPRLRPPVLEPADFERRYGPALGPSCWAEFAAKRLDAAATERANARLAGSWEAIRARIARVRRPVGELEAALRAVGAPLTPADLGWPEAFYREAVRHAREIRGRYTFLDLAADSGAFEAPGFLAEL